MKLIFFSFKIFSFLFWIFQFKFSSINCGCSNGEPYKLNNECVFECNEEELIYNKTCIPVSSSESHIRNVFEIIESYIISDANISNEIIIEGEGITYQITTNKLIESHINNNNSIYLDLGEPCLKKIKELDFIIILINIINTNYTTSTKGLKIISLNTELSINLLCGGENIYFGIPVSVPKETKEIYSRLKDAYNYDILNLNSSFYIDICEIYTTEDETDMSLTQRLKVFGAHGIDVCAKNCEYKKYDSDTDKIYCECYVETGNEEEEEKRNIGQQIYDKLAEFLDLINFDVMLCVKLVYTLGRRGLLKNYGFMIMTLASFFFIISMIISFFIFNKSITKIIEDINNLKMKFRTMLEEIQNAQNNNNENDNNNQNDYNEFKNKNNRNNNNNEIKNKNKNEMILKLNEDSLNKKIDNEEEEEEEEDEEGEEEEDDEIEEKEIGKDKNKEEEPKEQKEKNNKNEVEKKKKKNNDSKNSTKENEDLKKEEPKKHETNEEVNNSPSKLQSQSHLQDNLKDNDVIKIIIPYDKIAGFLKRGKKKKKTKKIKNKNEIETKNENNLISGDEKNKKEKRKNFKKRKKIKKVKKPIRYEIKLIDEEKANNPPKKKSFHSKKDLNIYNLDSKKEDYSVIHNLNESKNKLTHKNQKHGSKRSHKSSKQSVNIYNKNHNHRNDNNITNDNIDQELDIKFGSNEFFQYLLIIPEDKRMQFLLEEELNGLEYQNALEIDKRSYCEIYFSFLKKQNIIIFCLSYCTNDYNLNIMKFSLLMLQIIFFMTVSAFFFTDNTLNNIYENKNKFDIPFMMRQLMLTFLICLGVNLIFKILMRTDNKIIEIKQDNENIKDGISSIKCKFIFYFVFGNLILMFGWFYISCFCSVLNHTQIILIKCAAYSFGITFAYHFIICLIAPSFRVWSLNSKNKDKKCLYEVSKILSFL